MGKRILSALDDLPPDSSLPYAENKTKLWSDGPYNGCVCCLYV